MERIYNYNVAKLLVTLTSICNLGKAVFSTAQILRILYLLQEVVKGNQSFNYMMNSFHKQTKYYT